MEVLLIDDGSSDSQVSCATVCQQYDWVTSYHKANGGLSDARNYGVLNKGDWITFLDRTIILEPCALELLAELQKSYQADMVRGKVDDNLLSSLSEFSLDQIDLDQVKVYDKKALTEMLYGDLVTVSTRETLSERTS